MIYIKCTSEMVMWLIVLVLVVIVTAFIVAAFYEISKLRGVLEVCSEKLNNIIKFDIRQLKYDVSSVKENLSNSSVDAPDNLQAISKLEERVNYLERHVIWKSPV